MVRVEQLRAEFGDKIRIRKIRAIDFAVEVPTAGFDRILGGFSFGDSVPIPFRVSQIAGDNGSIGWYGIKAPMDDDAKFGIWKPLRRGALVKRIPGWLVILRCCESRAREHDE